MDTHGFHRLITLVTATGRLLLTLLTAPACKGQSPVAPEGVTPGRGPSDPAAMPAPRTSWSRSPLKPGVTRRLQKLPDVRVAASRTVPATACPQ